MEKTLIQTNRKQEEFLQFLIKKFESKADVNVKTFKIIKKLLKYNGFDRNAEFFRGINFDKNQLVLHQLALDSLKSFYIQIPNDFKYFLSILKQYKKENNNRKIIYKLHQCATSNNCKVGEKLLKKINFNINNNYAGMPILCQAIVCGNEQFIQLLLKYDANVNAIDANGQCALHYSVERGNLSITECLLKNGANINAKMSNTNCTPLHIAVSRRNLNLVKCLLTYDADPNCQNSYGLTPLHVAANMFQQCIDLLLQHGADINLKTICGHTVVDAVHSDRLSITKSNSFHRSIVDGYNAIYNDIDTIESIPYVAYDINPTNKIIALYLLGRHIVKLYKANFHISNEILLLVQGGKLANYQQDCQNELLKMQTTALSGHISLYTVLRLSIVNLAKLQYYTKLISHDNILFEFPIYSRMILYKLNKSNQRFRLIQSTNCILYWFFDMLPDLCIENISDYLSEMDLKSLLINKKSC